MSTADPMLPLHPRDDFTKSRYPLIQQDRYFEDSYSDISTQDGSCSESEGYDETALTPPKSIGIHQFQDSIEDARTVQRMREYLEEALTNPDFRPDLQEPITFKLSCRKDNYDALVVQLTHLQQVIANNQLELGKDQSRENQERNQEVFEKKQKAVQESIEKQKSHDVWSWLKDAAGIAATTIGVGLAITAGSPVAICAAGVTVLFMLDNLTGEHGKQAVAQTLSKDEESQLRIMSYLAIAESIITIGVGVGAATVATTTAVKTLERTVNLANSGFSAGEAVTQHEIKTKQIESKELSGQMDYIKSQRQNYIEQMKTTLDMLKNVFQNLSEIEENKTRTRESITME